MSELPCPKCAQMMSVWIAGDLELDHCGSCKGLWFDANELTRHLANIGAGRLAEEPSHGAPTKLLCPRCKGQRLEGAFLYDVPVECCPTCHGVFLDLGEVHELLEPAWLAEPEGPRRQALQALIMAGGALHHLSEGNRAGALGLLPKSAARLAQVPDALELDLASFARGLQTLAAAVDDGTVQTIGDLKDLPRLEPRS